MAERKLTDNDIAKAFAHPDKIQNSFQSHDRFIIKKIYRNGKRNHLLLIIFEKKKETILVITVIDTSKVDKYY